ncbi:MAG: hypothetical protein ABI977_26050, partial [Acidobacteriota bacterium]
MKQLGHRHLCAIIAIFLGQAAVVFAHQTAPELELNKPVEREITADDVHTYRLKLAAGQFAHITPAGQGISLSVIVFSPDGKRLIEAGKLDALSGARPLTLVGELPGEYRIQIWSPEKKSGRYLLSLDERRDATPQDRQRAAAEAAFLEAKLLSHRGRKEDSIAAIEKLKEVLPFWRALHNRPAE